MVYPNTPSNLRVDMVPGMTRAGVEAAELVKHAQAINALEQFASPVGHQHTLNDSKVGSFYQPSGAFPLTPQPLWRANYLVTVTAIWAYRVGGTAATVNSRKVSNVTAVNLLTADFAAPVGPPWGLAGPLAAPAALQLAVGDSLEVMLQSITGTVTLVAIQVDYSVVFQ